MRCSGRSRRKRRSFAADLSVGLTEAGMARRTSTADDWYAARAVFIHDGVRPRRRRKRVYEERIVLIRAATEADAIRQAEVEAAEYAKAHDGVSYAGFLETFRLFGSRLGSGSEVFSLMRSSNLTPSRYVSRYLDDGAEHRRK
jgi:hypothetical protein